MVNNIFEAQSVSEDTYIPFEDGIIFESQEYYRLPKCEYCGKPANPANCHAHKDWCPYYCNPNPVSLNGELLSFSIIILLYILIKKFKK